MVADSVAVGRGINKVHTRLSVSVTQPYLNLPFTVTSKIAVTLPASLLTTHVYRPESLSID